MVVGSPLDGKNVKSSSSELLSLESFQIAESSMRPSFFRTTFHESGPSTLTDRVVPKPLDWSVPSTTIVSAPPPKSKVYVFAPTLATFISSVSWLLDGLSFQSPTNGLSAAQSVPVTKQAASSN